MQRSISLRLVLFLRIRSALRFSGTDQGGETVKEEEILSAGIDIGTSTTQLVFSRMLLQNTADQSDIEGCVLQKQGIFHTASVQR